MLVLYGDREDMGSASRAEFVRRACFCLKAVLSRVCLLFVTSFCHDVAPLKPNRGMLTKVRFMFVLYLDQLVRACLTVMYTTFRFLKFGRSVITFEHVLPKLSELSRVMLLVAWNLCDT